jgi:hypothetical protein
MVKNLVIKNQVKTASRQLKGNLSLKYFLLSNSNFGQACLMSRTNPSSSTKGTGCISVRIMFITALCTVWACSESTDHFVHYTEGSLRLACFLDEGLSD